MERSFAPGFEFESSKFLHRHCHCRQLAFQNFEFQKRIRRQHIAQTKTHGVPNEGVGTGSHGAGYQLTPVALGDIQSTGGQFGLEIFDRSNNTRGQLPSRGTSMPPLPNGLVSGQFDVKDHQNAPWVGLNPPQVRWGRSRAPRSFMSAASRGRCRGSNRGC